MTKFIPYNMQVKLGRQTVVGELYTIPEFELIEMYESDNIDVTNILICSNKTATLGSYNSN